jgi:hypothetical protein
MARKKKEEEIISSQKQEVPEAEYDGHIGEIDKEAVENALTKFQKYKDAKSGLENRIRENQQWFKGRYATVNDLREDESGAYNKPDSKSAWAFNSILGKHADAMDNIPTANILPREESDAQSAEMLSKIVPLVMDKCHFQKKYYDVWYDKLISGGGIYKAYWDNSLSNGLGDINIIEVDPLNLYWEPACEDIQESENIFHVDYVKNATIKQQYPFMDGKLSESAWDASTAMTYESVEEQNKEHSDESVVYDWWYKKRVGTKTVVHLCKFCNGEVLWASENTDVYKDTGYYDHGKYPFVFDVLFPVKGSPFGFGYIDVMKSPQFVIDSLDESIVKYAKMAGKPRFFKKKNSQVDAQQFANWDTDFVDVDGSQLDETNIRQIQLSPFPQFIPNHWQNKIEELKETSGNRDFSQGGTNSGVTAGSAILALQEAGSKLSRDIIKSSYWAYEEIVNLVVELMRQFYTEDRYFRIEAPNGEEQFVRFSNQSIKPVQTPYLTGDGIGIAERIPEFDYKIVAQKMSPFQREAQNQLAIQLFQMGVFNPQMADQVMPFLEMMQFEGIDALKKKVSENGMMYQQLLQMTSLATQMAQILDAEAVIGTGDPNSGQWTQQVMAVSQQGNPAQPVAGHAQAPTGGVMGLPATETTVQANARERAEQTAMPR